MAFANHGLYSRERKNLHEVNSHYFLSGAGKPPRETKVCNPVPSASGFRPKTNQSGRRSIKGSRSARLLVVQNRYGL
jgi:hypothetical protein